MTTALKRARGPYYVYMLLCDDGSFYTGYSNNPTSRLLTHMKGQGARYTRMHKPSKIIYLEKHRTQSAAMKREKQIKTLTHEEKRTLSKAGTRRHSARILKDRAISV